VAVSEKNKYFRREEPSADLAAILGNVCLPWPACGGSPGGGRVTATGREAEFSWQLTPTGTDARLRGLDVVGRSVVWVSGSEGTVLRTLDGGETWEDVSPPGTEELEFRDVEAFDHNTATILSVGTGGDSRIYRTGDGGAMRTLTFLNSDENAFYDCMDFFNRRHGWALSDPVDGKFRILCDE
jgi:photosystem II stability/assembly factor-like uncharacterized protein